MRCSTSTSRSTSGRRTCSSRPPCRRSARRATARSSTSRRRRPASPSLGQAVYGLTKAALEYLTKSWAAELAPDRIRVNCVAPGPVDTPIHLSWAPDMKAAYAALRGASPLGLIADPDDIARWVDKLCDPARRSSPGRSSRSTGARRSTAGRRPSPMRPARRMPHHRRTGRADEEPTVLKKLINDPFDAVDEMLDGFVAAHADVVRLAAPHVVARREPRRRRRSASSSAGAPATSRRSAGMSAGAWPTRPRSATSSPRRDRDLPGRHPSRDRRGAACSRLRQLRRRRPQLRPGRRARGRRGDRDADDPGADDVASAPPADRSGDGDRRRRLRVQDRRRGGRARLTTWRASSASPGGANAATVQPRRRARPVRGPRRRPADLRDRAGRDRDRDGDPRRARDLARRARAGRPGRGAPGRGDPGRSGGDRRAGGGGVALLVNGLGVTAQLDLYVLYRAHGACSRRPASGRRAASSAST